MSTDIDLVYAIFCVCLTIRSTDTCKMIYICMVNSIEKIKRLNIEYDVLHVNVA